MKQPRLKDQLETQGKEYTRGYLQKEQQKERKGLKPLRSKTTNLKRMIATEGKLQSTRDSDL